MTPRHDVAITDEDGEFETIVTVTAMNGDEQQAEEIAELVRDHYGPDADAERDSQ